jgi:hypothetical protein
MYKEQVKSHSRGKQRTHFSPLNHITASTIPFPTDYVLSKFKMQFTLALLSGLTLVTSAVAQDKLPRALDFTTFPCIECARTGPDGCGSRQINHHDRFSDTCYPLEAGQESIRVDHVNDANHNCARKYQDYCRLHQLDRHVAMC